jgi:hypothetical protein
MDRPILVFHHTDTHIQVLSASLTLSISNKQTDSVSCDKIKRILTYECRCNKRQKEKLRDLYDLVYCDTELRGGLEHIKTETRLRGGRFEFRWEPWHQGDRATPGATFF